MDRVEHIKRLFEECLPFFSALGDPVRQTLVLNMMQEEVLSVKELASRTKLSRPTVSHHLKILKQANIIVEHKEGRQTFYRPQPGKYFYTLQELIKHVDSVITEQKEVSHES